MAKVKHPGGSKQRNGRLEAMWRRRVREHGCSGLTVRAFCERHGLTESAFYCWRRELRRRDARSQRVEASVPAAFVPVRVTDETPAWSAPIVLELPGAWRVHLSPPIDREALGDVLTVLRLDDRIAASDIQREDRPC